MKYILLVITFAALGLASAQAQNQVGVNNIKTHMGQNVIVSDRLIDISYNEDLKETYLTIGNDMHEPNLTVIIKETAGKKLNDWIKNLSNSQDIRVSGKLYTYQGKPSILVSEPSQLKLSLVDNIVKEGFGGF